MKKNYGLPYQGSKNKIAEDIVDFLPKKKILVDLFGGGGAISDCAAQKQKYDKIIYNELNSIITETFQKAINGEYENDHRWISREDFFRLKDTDGYVAVCFSFSNNLYEYMYSPKIEPYKRAYHYAIVFDDFEPFRELFDDETTEKMKKSVKGVTNLKERRLKFTKALGDYILSLENKPKILNFNGNADYALLLNLECDERLNLLKHTCLPFKTYIGDVSENLLRSERLNVLKQTMNTNGNPRNLNQNLECDERFDLLKHSMCFAKSITHLSQNLECSERFNLSQNQIEVSSLDYASVQLPKPEDCVLYCDIPYENTKKYKQKSFDYQRFYDWCKQKHSEGYQIYVSSYELPEDLFTEVWSKQRYSTYSKSKGKQVIEKLFVVK